MSKTIRNCFWTDQSLMLHPSHTSRFSLNLAVHCADKLHTWRFTEKPELFNDAMNKDFNEKPFYI